MEQPETDMFDDDFRSEIVSKIRQKKFVRQIFVPGTTPVPVSGKVVGTEETALMVEAALDGWLTAGRFNDTFEGLLSDFLGAKHVLTVNSGSSANLVALSALTSPQLRDRRIQPGDEVITAAAGFPTTIAPILQVGATPVFVDIDAAIWNVSVEAVERAIGPKTRAVVLAHTLGMPFDAEALRQLCDAHGLWLVEDCCDALGARWNGSLTGSFGHMGTLSFYPAHHITTGEGGAVFTNDPLLARVMESFRDWGRHCHCRPGQDNACGRRYEGQYGDLPAGYDHKYVYAHAGFNLKMTDMAAACGVAQMQRLPGFIEARRRNHAFLRGRLQSCPWLELPCLPSLAEPSWFGFPVILSADAPQNRLDLLRGLDAKRIGTRLLFAGNAVRQPFMQERSFRCAGPLENSDRIMERGFWLGVWPGLDETMLAYVAESVLELLGGGR